MTNNFTPAKAGGQRPRLSKEEYAEKMRKEKEAVYQMADETATGIVASPEKFKAFDDEQLIRRINTMLKKTFGLWIYKKEKEENIRCLCPKCLSEYINNPNYIVRRLDPFAKEKDRCDKCDKAGWDYVVTERSSVRKGKSGSYEK